MKTHAVLFLILMLAGCVSDVTNDKRFPTDYIVGGTYRVQQTLLLLDLGDYAIEVPRDSQWEVIADLNEAKSRVQDFAGYVPAGTLITL